MFRIAQGGVGSGRVEQLSSFAIRYAEAMCVSFVDFYRHLLAPQLYAGKAAPRRIVIVSQAVIDGMTRSAVDWSSTLEKTCSVSNLSTSTLLPFAGAIGARRLVEVARKWCPDCLQDMVEEGAESVYEPLVWRLEEVKVCPHHNGRPLVSNCPRCEKAGQLPLVFNSRVGCCRHCGAWMGSRIDGLAENPVTDAFELHSAVQCEQLLSLPAQFPEGARVLPSNVTASAIRDVFFEGNGAAMARSLGALPGQANGYASGEFPAPLHFYLRASYVTGASMHQMFVSNDYDSCDRARDDASFGLRRARSKRQFEQAVIDGALTEAIAGDGSKSVRAVAQNLSLDPVTVWRRSPALCAQVSRQHAVFIASAAAKKREEFQATVEEVFSTFAQRGVKPTAAEIKIALGDPACFLNDWKRAVLKKVLREFQV